MLEAAEHSTREMQTLLDWLPVLVVIHHKGKILGVNGMGADDVPSLEETRRTLVSAARRRFGAVPAELIVEHVLTTTENTDFTARSPRSPRSFARCPLRCTTASAFSRVRREAQCLARIRPRELLVADDQVMPALHGEARDLAADVVRLDLGEREQRRFGDLERTVSKASEVPRPRGRAFSATASPRIARRARGLPRSRQG